MTACPTLFNIFGSRLTIPVRGVKAKPTQKASSAIDLKLAPETGTIERLVNRATKRSKMKRRTFGALLIAIALVATVTGFLIGSIPYWQFDWNSGEGPIYWGFDGYCVIPILSCGVVGLIYCVWPVRKPPKLLK
jgi:hypothetical protein